MNPQQFPTFSGWSDSMGLTAQPNGPSTPIPTSVASAPLSINNPIILPGAGLSVSESAKSLFGRIGPTHTMFWRGGAVVEVTTDPNGNPQLAILTPAAFRSRIEKHGTVLVYRSGANGEPVLKLTTCSEDIAKALLHSREAQLFLPPISMVTRCPIAVGSDGGFRVLNRGYHPEFGGTYVTGAAELPTVGFEEAVNRLKGLIREFDFVTQSDQSRALALMITPALKMGGLIQGAVPIAVAEADKSQAGKTYLLKLISAIYREDPKMIAPRKGGVGSMDESFSQALIEGKPFILLDNLRGKLDSPYIESFLTCGGNFSVRVPYRGEIDVNSSRFIVMISSNGLDTTTDLANRSCIVRIRKRDGIVYVKDRDGRDMLQHIRFYQPYYLACIFVVIQAWFIGGRWRSPDTRHDFTEWAQLLDWIVQMIFQSAPLLDGHQGAQQRVSKPGLVLLRNVAIAVREAGLLGTALSASDISTFCEQSDIQIPGLQDGNSEHAKRQIGCLLKPVFDDSNSVEIDGFIVMRTEKTEKRQSGGDYLCKFYEFNLG